MTNRDTMQFQRNTCYASHIPHTNETKRDKDKAISIQEPLINETTDG